ncbi:MAG: poly-gamma-glutamate biosynthesis protein PgsC [Acidobacteria bacterium]|nr:poly-gamma-glutamate biosynthesis protein PgsC [Acidobacteriota bacterium]MBU4493692.1 poly-gamma-glutamate biosynthesis protein PgsC [Acidobacteriota bacterium]MCG2817214.1 poly-gamma-glutamate biosynthesis protein PgsC [Candidatus Aminicenantes bacterium]
MIVETFVIGIVLALLFAELTDIYPGGIVVPAFLALHGGEPAKILLTVAAAGLAFGCVFCISRVVLLFGKRRFVLCLLFGVFWSLAAGLLLPDLFVQGQELRVIGWIVPGLLANTLMRQKALPTFAGLVVVTSAAYFATGLLSSLY